MTAPVEHYGAIVVGSGFGGSVTACRLAQAGMEVCLLERGRRYPPGSFARSPRDMRDNFWDPVAGRFGLFEVLSFGKVDAVVSAGLGGGSLIYANVLLRKEEDAFVRRRPDGSFEEWPIRRSDLERHYDHVEAVLTPQPYPLDHAPYDATPKTLAMRKAAADAGVEWFLPPLAVTFANDGGPPVPGEPVRDAGGRTDDNLHRRSRTTCRLCGECDIGCNYGSKNTLDFTYLTLADKAGAVLRDGCEVTRIAPRPGGGYLVDYVVHAPDGGARPAGRGGPPPVTASADRLVLAAGTLGTTALLLRNRANFPGLSRRLGHFFSGNGDFLGFVHGARESVGGVEGTRVLSPSRGPVITSSVRVPRDGTGGGFYVQEGGYPVLVDWLVEASNGLGVLGRTARAAGERVEARLEGRRDPELDPQIVEVLGDAHRSSSILPLLGMGLDTPDGVLSIDDRSGALRLHWSARRSSAYFSEVESTMEEIAAALGARFQVDPLWYLRHKVVTVHPVGGCAMGRSPEDGVVDGDGEVFGYPGLVVADGAVMPGPVGPNPSLTIAALADRFAEHQIDAPRR